jgi:hypothetical protein
MQRRKPAASESQLNVIQLHTEQAAAELLRNHFASTTKPPAAEGMVRDSSLAKCRGLLPHPAYAGFGGRAILIFQPNAVSRSSKPQGQPHQHFKILQRYITLLS